MAEIRECKKHGLTEFVRRPSDRDRMRCKKCASESVIKRRRNKKLILIQELGGECYKCQYKRFPGALEFHHIDPKQKSFTLSTNNNRSLDSMREEAKKCVLLCANCHAELHGKLFQL